MNCPKCGSDLSQIDTTVYVLNKRTKKYDPVIEPWSVCTKTITDLLSENRVDVCRFVAKSSEVL